MARLGTIGSVRAHRERGLELAEAEARAGGEIGRFFTLELVDELETFFKGASFQELTGFVEFWIRHAPLSLMRSRDALCRRSLPANNANDNESPTRGRLS